MEQVGRKREGGKEKGDASYLDLSRFDSWKRISNGKNEAIRILWPIMEDLLLFIVPRFEKMCSGGLETCHSSINVSGTYHRFFKFLFEINIVISKRVEGILRPCLSLISTIFISKADRRGFDTHDEGLKEERIRGEKWIVANW